MVLHISMAQTPVLPITAMPGDCGTRRTSTRPASKAAHAMQRRQQRGGRSQQRARHHLCGQQDLRVATESHSSMMASPCALNVLDETLDTIRLLNVGPGPAWQVALGGGWQVTQHGVSRSQRSAPLPPIPTTPSVARGQAHQSSGATG